MQRAQAERDRQIQQARDTRDARLRAAQEAKAAHLRAANDSKEAEIRNAQQSAATTLQPANDRLLEAHDARGALETKRASYHQQLEQLYATTSAHLATAKVAAAKSARAEYHSVASIPETAFQQVFDTIVSAGYGLISMQGYEFRGRAYFNTVWNRWTKHTLAWYAFHSMDRGSYERELASGRGKGFRLFQVTSYTSGGSLRYSAIFVANPPKNAPAWTEYHEVSGAEHQRQFNALVSQGYRLTCQTATVVSGAVCYSAMYDNQKGGEWGALFGLDTNACQAKVVELRGGKSRHRLTHLHACSVGGTPLYCVIWDDVTYRGKWVSEVNLSIADYYARDAELARSKLAPRLVVAGENQRTIVYGAIWAD